MRVVADYSLAVPNNPHKYWECECCGSLLVTGPHDSAEDYQCPQCHKVMCDHGGKYVEISAEQFACGAGIKALPS